jgi:hypothetical protein
MGWLFLLAGAATWYIIANIRTDGKSPPVTPSSQAFDYAVSWSGVIVSTHKTQAEAEAALAKSKSEGMTNAIIKKTPAVYAATPGRQSIP